MAVIPLTGQSRHDVGKGPARRSRREGRIPCVLYGHGEKALSVAIGTREFELAMHGHLGANPIVKLQVGPSGEAYTALVREIQRDPVSREILHVDFQHISLTEMIEVNVTLRLVGTPRGVKEAGGILEAILRDVKVRCLPTAIPAHIDVDVNHLGIGDSVHVRGLVVKDVEILNDPDSTVATVVPPTVMEEKPAEAVVTEVAAEPELITKGKKEDEEAAEPAGEKKPAEKKPAEKKAPEKK